MPNKDNQNQLNQDAQSETPTNPFKQTKPTLRDKLTSTNFKTELKQLRKTQGKKPMKPLLKGFMVLATLTLGFMYFTSYVTNKEVKSLDDQRDTRLDIYETTKFAVLDDINAYLTISSKEDYKRVKSSFTAPQWYKDELFGTKYHPSNFYGAVSIQSVDVSYTLPDTLTDLNNSSNSNKDNEMKFYLVLNATKGTKTQQLHLVVFVQNNQIYDILVL